MRVSTARRLARLFAGCALAAAGPSWADGLNVSPVVIEIDSPRKAVAITITNDSNRAATFQADTFLWRQVDGVDQYEPDDDLMVVPAIVDVPPNGSQVFRVMLRTPTASPVERTYRVMLEDISSEVARVEGSGLSFRFKHNLPVLIAPSVKVVNSMQWRACTSAPRAGEACVRLRNSGNRRIKIDTITVGGEGWSQSLSVQPQLNVLAGAEREWRLPLAGRSGKLSAVKVRTAQGETLSASQGDR